MRRSFRSIDEAWQAFDAYARLEPRLRPLWDLCRGATPPARDTELVDDVYDVDPFEIDILAADKPTDGWCAEDFFLLNVKSTLLVLVGLQRPHRTGSPCELHTNTAYDELYDLLINWALNRTCACCTEPDDDDNDDPPDQDRGGSPAHW